MDNPKDSKNINVNTLKNFRITYEKEVLSDNKARDLPERVQVLRGGLLSSSGRIIKEYIESSEIKEQLKEGDIPGEYIYAKTDGLPRLERKEIEKRLNPAVELAIELRDKARNIHEVIGQEKKWEALLLDTVFLQLKYRTTPASGYWNEFALGQQIILESDHRWNEDHDIEKAAQFGPDLTQPQPDIYLGFPIRDLQHEESHGFSRHEFTQNFSIDTLGVLLNKGLMCTPTTGVRRYLTKRGKSKVDNESTENDRETTIESGIQNEGGFSREHLLCFPWAVVELKIQSKISGMKSPATPAPTEKCYCQGANAASRALRMFEILSQYSDTANEDRIPPVVVLTFIGPVFRLWIAYSSLDNDGKYHYMICIEEQSLLEFWGGLRLYQIVNDMSFWATTILKPKISMYIDQWRLRYMHGFRLDLSKDRLLLNTVQKVEERQKQIGLYRSSNLAEMVRMALIIQEITSTDVEVRSNGGSPSKTQGQAVPPIRTSTPVPQSDSKVDTWFTKSSTTVYDSAIQTPSRPGPMTNRRAQSEGKPAADLESIKPGPLPFKFSGTTSSVHSTRAYNAKISPSAFTENIFKFSMVSKSEAASLSKTMSSVTAVKKRNIFESSAETVIETQRDDRGSSQATTDNARRPTKESNVSAGRNTMEDNTDILSSERGSSKRESSDDERLSEVIDDIRLFLWPKECS